MKTIIAVLGGMLIAATSARADEGCSKDTDCKGDRICNREHICVFPPAKPPPPPDASGAAPATYAPAPPPPYQQPPAIAPAAPIGVRAFDTRHRHLGGYIRPDLGFGYFTTSATVSGSDATLSGFAGTFGFAAGGAISENNILAVHIWDTVVTNPDVSYGGVSGSANGDLTMIGIGPEYTRYTNDNLYFSISPSFSRLHTSSGSSSGDSNWGFGLRAALGKEWWASDHWGLGVVGHVSMSINEDSGSNAPTWTSWAFTLAFSATYN